MEYKRNFYKGKIWKVFFFLIINFSISAQVGIGTENPSTMLDVNGALSLRQEGLITLVAGANGIIDLGPNPYTFYRIEGPTADFSISGFSRVPGSSGHIIFLQNNTSHNMTILNTNLRDSEDYPNQIYIPDNQNVVISGQNASITFMYVKLRTGKWWFASGGGLINSIRFAPPPDDPVLEESSTTYTVPIPGAFNEPPGNSKRIAAVNVNVLGPSNGSVNKDITIEYREAQDRNIIFRVKNSSNNVYDNLEYILTLHH